MLADWSRRKFLKLGGLGTLGVVGGTMLQACGTPLQGALSTAGVKIVGGHDVGMNHLGHAMTGAEPHLMVPATYGGFDPTAYLTHFDRGTVVGTTADGRTIREFTVVSEDKEIEIYPGVKFPAWTFNGTVPGPTLRCTEDELVRIHYTNNGDHPHSIHLHGVHSPEMDGLIGIGTGGSFTYEFIAEPFGLFPYHCHVMPLTKHISKGLYGTMIVDPKQGRPLAKEMVMILNGFDVDFDGANEFYTVNGVPFHHQNYPIQVKVGEPLRIYLVNMTEFDLVNSYHQHAAMFRYFPNGTSLSTDILTDTVTLGQGERGIIEMTLKFPGMYMFHAHQSEFAELGWIGMFEATV